MCHRTTKILFIVPDYPDFLNNPVIQVDYFRALFTIVPSSTIHITFPASDDAAAHALFTELFRTHGAKIFFYFKKYVKRDEVAEDLLQEVFANIWSKRERLNEEKNIPAYLFVSARNQLFNHLKSATAAEAVSLPEDATAFSYEHITENISYKETRAIYYEALATLSPLRRKAFILSREHGLTYQEIAQQMGISPRTVEKHISEALQLLRGKMSAPCIACFLFIIW